MGAYQEIIKKLDSKKIYYKVHFHDEIPTVEEAKKKVDFDINRCLKTVAFSYLEKYIFVSLLAEEKLDYSKLCTQLNINRSNLKKADSNILEERYGYEFGGIAPISISDDIIIVFDDKVDDNKTIYCGSGCRDKTIEIAINDLINLNNTVVMNVSKSEKKEFLK